MSFVKTFAAAFLLSLFLTTVGNSTPVVSFFNGNAITLNYSSTFSSWSSLANVSVTGRVKTTEGRPIKAAAIIIKDANTNAVVRSALSSSFGYYRLDEIETGRTYVLSVSHKNYLFVLPSQLLEINEDRTGMDFTGEIRD
ncbi:MAG: carboxypeptidase-like regulatory domain-containing protein [Pyrinomonadaceae bacterium]